MSEFTGIKERLVSIREKVRESIVDTNKTVIKIDAFGSGLREANQKIVNSFRTFADKAEIDYSQNGEGFSKTEMIKKPWQIKEKLFSGMELRLDAAIDKVDILSKDVEISRIEKADLNIYTVAMPKVAENSDYRYGSEAFEAYQKQVSDKNVIILPDKQAISAVGNSR